MLVIYQVNKSVREWDRDKDRREVRIRRHSDNKTVSKLAFTSDSTNVQAVSHRTFAAERAVRVDALAINTRVIDAFINIYN